MVSAEPMDWNVGMDAYIRLRDRNPSPTYSAGNGLVVDKNA